MDWLWPIYRTHVTRSFPPTEPPPGEAALQQAFLLALGRSGATLYVMEPVAGTVRFKGLGQWSLAESVDLLADPNAFIADRFGGGKFKLNFHDRDTFVGTHNFRTTGEELWRTAEELWFD